MNHLRDGLDVQRAEEIVQVLEHRLGHVGELEDAAIQRVHAVPRADPRGALAGRPERVFQLKFAGRIRQRGQHPVQQRVDHAGRFGGLERVVGQRQELLHIAHQVGAKDVLGCHHHGRADLRHHESVDPTGQGSTCVMGGVVRQQSFVLHVLLVDVAEQRHPQHRRAHAVRHDVDLGGTGGPDDVLCRQRDVGKADLLERPRVACGGHAGAGAQVDDPHVAAFVAQVLRQAARQRRVRERGAAGAVAVDQQHRRLGVPGSAVAGQAKHHRRAHRKTGRVGGNGAGAKLDHLGRRQARHRAGQALRRACRRGIGLAKTPGVNLDQDAHEVQRERGQVDQRGRVVLLVQQVQQGHLLFGQVGQLQAQHRRLQRRVL